MLLMGEYWLVSCLILCRGRLSVEVLGHSNLPLAQTAPCLGGVGFDGLFNKLKESNFISGGKL